MMVAPRVQISYAGEAFRESWQILRKWPALWLVILAAGLPGILVSPVYRLPTPGEPDPGSFAWLAKMDALVLVAGFVRLLITAVLAIWVRGSSRVTPLPGKQVFSEAWRLWRPFLIFDVCFIVAWDGFTGWGQWLLRHTAYDRWGMLISWWIPLGVSQVVMFTFWALVPGVILAKDLRGGLRLSFAFVRRFPVLVVVLLAVNTVWGWGVWPPIWALITSKTFHWGQGWFDNPLVTTPRLRWIVSHAAEGYLSVVQFVSVWRRWE